MEYKHFRFHEDFSCYDKKLIPYGIDVEQVSLYTHMHVRVEDGTYYITCRGNQFFAKTPVLGNFCSTLVLGFHNMESNASFRILFGYERIHRIGYALDFTLKSNQLIVSIVKYCQTETTTISEAIVDYMLDLLSANGVRYTVKLSINNDMVSVSFADIPFSFPMPNDYRLVGRFCASQPCW